MQSHHHMDFPIEKNFEPVFQIELQKAGWYYLHYKNFRIEMNKQMLKEMSEIFNKAVE